MMLHLKTFVSSCHVPYRCYHKILPRSRRASNLCTTERRIYLNLMERKQLSISSLSINFKSNTIPMKSYSNCGNVLLENKINIKMNDFLNIQPVRYFQSKQKIEEVNLVDQASSEENDHSHNKEDKKISLILYSAFTALFSVGIFYAIEKQNITEVFTFHCNRVLQNLGIEVSPLLKPIHCVQFTIIGLNVLVWCLWKLPVLHPALSKIFLNSTSSSQSILSLIGSAFSHVSFLHLAVNMYVLLTFIEAWDHYATYHRNILPTNFMSADRFLSFYLSAATISSFWSLAVKKLGGIATPSLGASGAVLALLGYICCKSPDSRLGVVFIPNWSFSSGNGLNAILAFDTVGLIFAAMTKWKYSFFDHAAHLSGALYGMWYAKYGEKFVHESLNKRRKKD